MLPPPDHAVQQVEAARCLLLEYSTAAEDRIERNRLDGIPAGDMPRIVLTSDVDLKFQGISPPRFEARLSLLVECWAESATERGLVDQLDILQGQVKDALLCDAKWVRQFTRFDDIKIRWRSDRNGERYAGVVQISIVGIWNERFPPRTPDDLRIITIGPTENATGPAIPDLTIKLPAASADGQGTPS